MKKINFILLVAVALTFSFSAFAQKPEQKKEKAEKKSKITDVTAKDYDEIVANLKKGDLNVDYVKLRRAYTKTKNYSPYGGGSERGLMNAALQKKDYKEALKVAEERLDDNYVDLYAHQVASVTAGQLKDEKKAQFHKDVFKNLIDAMLKSGDGKSAETAIFCIGISEQHTFMGWFGFERKAKGLKQANGSIFDVHTAVNPETNEEREFWFNIDEVFGKF